MSKWGKRSALNVVVGMLVAGATILGGGLPALAAADPASPSSAESTYYAKVAAAEQATGVVHAAKPEASSSLESRARTLASSTGSVVAANFAAGNLLSDAVFFKGTAMSEDDVQTFLDGQVGVCNPDKKPNVEKCLKSYVANSEARPVDAMCNGYTAAPNESAATIIYKVGLSCGINQGVLLALLQKEQSLVTDDWPSATQYKFATGYACPDDPGVGCDPDTAGFFAQVYGAAWQFKRYANPAGTTKVFTWYPVGSVSKIAFSSTKTSCGTGSVAIWNKATAALYYYTPYQPNAAALKNFFGTGDSCSEYGNRNFWGSFYQWFGNPTAGSVPSANRLSGSDRYQTAVLVSKNAFAPGVKVAYVATGASFPDALGAASAAAFNKSPLLLVQTASIPTAVKAELQRLKPARIVVVGGAAVVSNSVQKALATIQPKTVRIAGSDRFATSRLIAQDAFAGTGAARAYVATGMDYPDALSAGAAAGAKGAPVILVNGKTTAVDAATKATLKVLKTTSVTIAGGVGVVSSGYQKGLAATPGIASVSRVSGADRYATSAAINANAFTSSIPRAYFATGSSFPDALAGAAAAGAAGAPLDVVPAGCVPGGMSTQVLSQGAKQFTLLGGSTVLGSGVAKLTVC